MTPAKSGMADLVDVVIEDERWAGENISKLAQASCRATLEHLNIPPNDFEIALLACDDSKIAALNHDFREKDAPTNVLSWPEIDLSASEAGAAPESPRPDPTEKAELGNIAIAYETCMAEANDQNLPPKHHISHLLVHGCLHLLGYDHVLEKDAALMEGLEVEILAKLGISDPY